jgi:Nucleotide modification associated domain 2
MKRIYFYKMTTDDGGAPHVLDDVLSLAICKPMIRRTAQPGDLILGFAANVMDPNNRLIYVARVAEKLRGDDYYTAKYSMRGDCIYARRGEEFVRRDNALYHHEPSDLPHDLGEGPTYSNANVLLSDDFRYFGANGNDDYKSRYPMIGEAVKKLGRGHRVEHPTGLREKLWQFAEEVLKTTQNEPGKPMSAPGCGVCRRDEDDEVCVVDDDEARTHC